MRHVVGLTLAAAALAACSGEAPEPEASPTGEATEAASPSPSPSPSETASAGVPPLGIAAGYYVDVGESCSSPPTIFYYDGKRVGYMTAGSPASDGFPADPGNGPETVDAIGPVSPEPGGFFIEDWAMIVKVLGPNRIQLEIQDTGPPMRLCPESQIPANRRVR